MLSYSPSPHPAGKAVAVFKYECARERKPLVENGVTLCKAWRQTQPLPQSRTSMKATNTHAESTERYTGTDMFKKTRPVP